MSIKSALKSAGSKTLDLNLRTVVDGVNTIPAKAHQRKVQKAAETLAEEVVAMGPGAMQTMIAEFTAKAMKENDERIAKLQVKEDNSTEEG